MTLVLLNCHLKISTPIGKSLWSIQILKGGFFCIEGQVMKTNLILLDLQGLDANFGIGWLAANYSFMDYFHKNVIFRRRNLLIVVFYRKRRDLSSSLTLDFFACRLLHKGCMRYLAYVFYTRVGKVRLDNVLVV